MLENFYFNFFIFQNPFKKVGWGRSENTGQKRHEDIPRQISIRAVNDSACYTINPQVAAISSLRTFCGGGNGTGPCKGDSGKRIIFCLQCLLQTFILGGGFYVKPGSTWVIKGIVSSALATGDYGCGVESFSVYTNVVKYLD